MLGLLKYIEVLLMLGFLKYIEVLLMLRFLKYVEVLLIRQPFDLTKKVSLCAPNNRITHKKNHMIIPITIIASRSQTRIYYDDYIEVGCLGPKTCGLNSKPVLLWSGLNIRTLLAQLKDTFQRKNTFQRINAVTGHFYTL